MTRFYEIVHWSVDYDDMMNRREGGPGRTFLDALNKIPAGETLVHVLEISGKNGQGKEWFGWKLFVDRETGASPVPAQFREAGPRPQPTGAEMSASPLPPEITAAIDLAINCAIAHANCMEPSTGYHAATARSHLESLIAGLLDQEAEIEREVAEIQASIRAGARRGPKRKFKL